MRAAIDQAETNHEIATITFSPSLENMSIDPTISGPSVPNIYGDTAFVIYRVAITIDGSAAPGLSIDGGGLVRLFAVIGPATLTLKDLTVTDGLAQGEQAATLSTAEAEAAVPDSEARFYDDGGAFTAMGVTFSNNSAQGGGGGHQTITTYPNPGGGGGGIGGPGGSGRSAGASGGGRAAPMAAATAARLLNRAPMAPLAAVAVVLAVATTDAGAVRPALAEEAAAVRADPA